MKIVKFNDGTYGIRRFSLSNFIFGISKYEYMSLLSGSWFTIDSMWFICCKGDLERCKKTLKRYTDKGEIVK